MLVDSHCHLDFPELRADMAGVMSRMSDNGVTHALTISTTLETFPAVREIARSLANVWCTAGVHPDERRDGREVELEELVGLAGDPKVVA
ncbi:MAG: TatD family hydrolase, partial [Usitatibacter sp.]